MKLQDRVAIVTGAAQGIGRAIAEKLSAEGAVVIVADLNAERAEQVAGEIPNASARAVDVASEEAVRGLVNGVMDDHGRLDVLVNNAAIVPFSAWDDIDFAEWRRVMSVNLDGIFLTCHYAQRPMREAGYGRIVNIASNVILAGTPNLAQYVASKGGVMAFTRALAREVGKYGITVNAVAPGLTASEGVLASPHAEAFDFVQALQCIPRRGETSDIAPSVAFLASEEAGWVTGQLLVADGGMTHN